MSLAAQILLLSGVTLAAAASVPVPHARVARQVSQLRDSYDFVIAGGGTAGLTVADRLTEAFPNRTRGLAVALNLPRSGYVLVTNTYPKQERSLSSSTARSKMHRASSSRQMLAAEPARGTSSRSRSLGSTIGPPP